MADRSTTLTIGAVLASNFRSTFTEARREVEGLSRTLDRLGARCSNAGLAGIRTAATAARDALRGLSTEASAAGRTIDAAGHRVASAAPHFSTLSRDARQAARDIGGLGGAMGSVGTSANGAAGLHDIGSEAQYAGRELRGLRIETATVGRALRALDGHLTRATTALGRFTGETRAATIAARGLDSVMGAVACGLLGVAGHTACIRQILSCDLIHICTVVNLTL